MTQKPVVLCVGRLYCDLIFTGLPRMPTLGTEIYAGGFGVHPGGGAFITAAHLAALDHGVALSAMLPPEPFGEIVSDDIEKAGIDLQLCGQLQKDCDPQVTVALAGQGDRAFVTRRTGPAFPPLKASELSRIGATHVHIGELATSIERPELIELARSTGATISLDCSWDDTLAAPDIAAMLSRVDLFLPNEAELQHLLEIGVPETELPLTVIKQGANGATAMVEGKRVHEPAKPVSAVDTTGAGDAFNAGFLSAWLAKDSLRACLGFGNAQGAKAISQRGGFRGA